MRRKLLHWSLTGFCTACALLCFLVLGWILCVLIRRGAPALDWSFLSGTMEAAGTRGGIRHHLAGTGILLLTTLGISAPIAWGLALTFAVTLKACPRIRQLLLVGLHLLNGIPAILMGIFGLIVFVQALGWGKSWLTGGILLALMILPTVTSALITRLKAIPPAQIEAAAALGLRPSAIIRAVWIPQGWSGWITGTLLGLSRAAGETAPLLFAATVFSGATLPDGIRENPVLSLPYHIFILAQDSYDPEAAPRLWGTALTLLLLSFLLALPALPARLRQQRPSRHD